LQIESLTGQTHDTELVLTPFSGPWTAFTIF